MSNENESLLNIRGHVNVTDEIAKIYFQYEESNPLARENEIVDMIMATAWVIQKAADEKWTINKFIRSMIAQRLAHDQHYENVVLREAYDETPKSCFSISEFDST